MFRANNFDKLLDKATSNLRLDPDWPTILQICDLIRQNDCTPKYAVTAIKKKLYSQNPHQAMFALLTLESVVKNCGSGIHDEVTSKAFCEMLRDLVKTTPHENLRTKILELIQAWGFAFRNNPKYRAVQDTVNILKAEGYKFPPLKESDAMFSADTAPEWADGEVCHRCRVAFSLMVRRHHCRACGQVFCQQCSSKNSTLPKFGIEKEVRVCDACYDKVSRPPTSTAKLEIVDTSSDYGPAAQPQKRPGKSEQDLQEEEELQLALALSQSEAEQKEKDRTRSRSHIVPDPVTLPTVSPTPSSVSASPEHVTQSNSELSRYLDRNYWEQRISSQTPTAPVSHTQSDTSEDYAKPATSKAQEDDNEDKEIDEFVEKLKSQVEIFVNRMKSNSSRGRSIANDTSVQSLFMNITAMHSQLLRYIQQQDDKRVYLESLQDKINQIRDSRAALDTLRAEHAARLAAQAEAAERQRQMQMAAKLQAMRKKKHEYLQYQRQLALQRVQEQEREMQMRQEQQKHQYMMASSTGFYMPGVTMQQFQPGFPNQPIYANPQFHQMMQTTDTVPPTGQPQISQAMALNANQIAAMSQSLPQLSNAYAMPTQAMTMSQAPMTTPSMNLARPSMTPQQMQQMMMQMRMAQPGVQSVPQMFPGQQNGQPQQQKQPPTSMMASMSIGQPNAQSQLTQANPMLGMQMSNMRMPIMQGQNPQFQMNQPNSQPQHMQPQLPGQPMSLPGQAPNQSMPQANNNPNLQQMPQNMQQPISMPSQAMPGQQMNMQAQQGPQSLPQQQMMNAGPHMSQIAQQNPQIMQQMGQMPQQMPQGQQMPQNPTMPQTQSMQMPAQQIPQQMPNNQGQPVKIVSQNFTNGQPAPPPNQAPPNQNQPQTQPQTPVKSESNNNTAELISFD